MEEAQGCLIHGRVKSPWDVRAKTNVNLIHGLSKYQAIRDLPPSSSFSLSPVMRRSASSSSF